MALRPRSCLIDHTRSVGAMKLEARSLRSESDQNAIGGISGLEVVLDEIKYRLPSMCANQVDYARGEECGVQVNPTMFNYHYTIKNNKVTDREIEKIKSEFAKIQQKYNPKITSMSFAPIKAIKLNQSTRMTLLQLQMELGTTFVGDLELHRNQSLDQLKQGLVDLDKLDTEQIKSPSVSLQCDAPELFKKKAEYLVVKSKHFRLNVQWGGYKYYDKNWISLENLLYLKTKWCNMVGISPRRTRRNRPPIRSNIAFGLKHGAHTFCFGVSKFDSKDDKSYTLDGDDWYYKETQNSYAYDVARSLNVAHGELESMGKLIGTAAFEEYYRNRGGLHITKSL